MYTEIPTKINIKIFINHAKKLKRLVLTVFLTLETGFKDSTRLNFFPLKSFMELYHKRLAFFHTLSV